MPFYQLFWGRVPLLKIDYKRKVTLILTSLLEDLVKDPGRGGGQQGLKVGNSTPCGGDTFLCGLRTQPRWIAPCRLTQNPQRVVQREKPLPMLFFGLHADLRGGRGGSMNDD